MEFFFAPVDGTPESIELPPEEHVHAHKSLRLREGDEAGIVNGNGTMYRCIVALAARDRTVCTVLETVPEYNEGPRRITLAVAVLKSEARFDWIVEKATELGVARIIPMTTVRTVRSAVRSDRLHAIARAAMKQCSRSRVPDITAVMSLSSALDLVSGSAVDIFHEKAQRDDLSMEAASTGDSGEICLFIGPEGGFSEDEIEYARSRGARLRSLGRRRLRTETAAIAALARISV